MNCTTCGTALVNGGACTVCNPWQTPGATAAAPNVGMPAPGVPPQAGPAGPQAYGYNAPPIPRRWQRLVDRSAARPVDMARALRMSGLVTAVQAAALALIGVVDFSVSSHLTANSQDLLLLSVLPLIIVRIVGMSLGGWISGAVSNLKLRPDISVGWFFQMPAMKRVIVATAAYNYVFLAYILIRVVQPANTIDAAQQWLRITGVVYFAAAVFQVASFATVHQKAYREICARLAVPPPWAAAAVAPQDRPAQGASA